MSIILSQFNFLFSLLILSLFAHVPLSAQQAKRVNKNIPFYLDSSVNIEDRVEYLLQKLTLEEKITLLHGNVTNNISGRFLAAGIPGYGIGQISTLNGRQGVGGRSFDGTFTTALPSTLSLSCTWDLDIAQEYGRLLGEEMLAMNAHVLFGPMINLVRTPLNGRNFENLGEDPYLAGKMAISYIKGVQEKKVAACACLIVANDYEKQRHFTSSNMDERTLREVHLLPYEMAAREGKVWTMMPSNSLLNGIHCAQNKKLLYDIMKDEIGYDGVMITDWRAAYDPVQAALGGTDITMGFCAYVFADGKLLDAVREKKVPMELIDDKVRRVLRLSIRTGVLNPEIREKGAVDSEEHRVLAREISAQGMVLLKNEGNLLPINLLETKRILITGPGADVVAKGGGSGNVHSKINISPVDGIQSEISDEAEIVYAKWENNHPTDSEIIDLERKAELADFVVFCAISEKYSEGNVMNNMKLPGKQNDIIKKLADKNKNIVVVLMAGSAVSVEPWVDSVPSILGAWYGGQATGLAIADILTGRVNPGGKLSFTMAKSLSDYSVHSLGEWPAKLIIDKDPGDAPITPEGRKAIYAYSGEYKEGVYVGHRWFDKQDIEPRFPFGFGLSYTKFSIADPEVSVSDDHLIVSCIVKNTGDRKGSEVVQVYVEPPVASVSRPLRELKGFSKVFLDQGELQKVEVKIPLSRLTYFDVKKDSWKLDDGVYGIGIGVSSRDIQWKKNIKINKYRYFKHQE